MGGLFFNCTKFEYPSGKRYFSGTKRKKIYIETQRYIKSTGMIETLLIVIGLLVVAMVLLSINIILRKGGTFRSEDVGQNKAMRERGIQCTRAQDKMAQRDKSSIYDMMK